MMVRRSTLSRDSGRCRRDSRIGLRSPSTRRPGRVAASGFARRRVVPRTRGYGYAGMFLTFGGFIRVCDPKMRWTCQRAARLPLYVPSIRTNGQRSLLDRPVHTPEVRFPRGSYRSSRWRTHGRAQLRPDGVRQRRQWEYGPGDLCRKTIRPAGAAALDYWMVYSSVATSQLMHDFDSSFDATVYGCPQPAAAAAGQYTLFAPCTSAGQGFARLSSVFFMAATAGRFSPGCSAGDALSALGSGHERVRVGAHAVLRFAQCASSSETWQASMFRLSPTSRRARPSGTSFTGSFSTILNGLDTTNTNVVVDQYFDGGRPLGLRPAWTPRRSMEPGWAAVFGDIMSHLNQPMSLVIDDSPFFAGARGISYGSTTSKHPELPPGSRPGAAN